MPLGYGEEFVAYEFMDPLDLILGAVLIEVRCMKHLRSGMRGVAGSGKK